MTKWIAGALIALLGFGTVLDADAQRRFGGAKNLGRQSPAVQPQQQRQATPPPAQQNSPQAAPAQGAQPSAAAKAPAAGAPAAARPSPWRGALLGLAAGLGIAALASALGLSEALTMFLTVLLVGMAVMLLLGFVLRRMRGPQAAPVAAQRGPGTYTNVGYETAPIPRPAPAAPAQRSMNSVGNIRRGSAMDEFMNQGASAPVPAALHIPAGFDTAGFLAQAKQNFTRLQHAWDARDLDEIAEFTTNDMFIALTHELRTRAGMSRTEIAALDAELLGIESGTDVHVASVKFEGTLRIDGTLEQVSEVWNLEKPVNGRGGWLLAGIQQLA